MNDIDWSSLYLGLGLGVAGSLLGVLLYYAGC